MTKSLAAVAFLVPDYDPAIAWFREALGFELLVDAPIGPGKRWVVVAPPGGAGARIVIAKASDDRQRAAVGAGVGGRVGYFLETDDFARDRAAMQARGVRFLEEPRREAYGIVAVFADPWGGKWDLLQPARAARRLRHEPRTSNPDLGRRAGGVLVFAARPRIAGDAVRHRHRARLPPRSRGAPPRTDRPQPTGRVAADPRRVRPRRRPPPRRSSRRSWPIS